MTDKAQIRAQAARLHAFFEAAGAVPVEAPLLLSADTLLDLYGEDIRARAYVTDDPDRGEMMLRPDFTVPVVEMHMEGGADPARYVYMGEVFRKQQSGSGRPTEYMQVGYEVFSRDAPLAADAEVFALFSEVLSPFGLRAVTGDIGILLAAVETLGTSQARKAALRRHIWRPRRFRALLERYTGRAAVPSTRTALLRDLDRLGADRMIAEAGPEIGLRSAGEVRARLATLQDDDAAPPLAGAEADVLSVILGIKAALPDAHEQLQDVCVDIPALVPAIDRFGRRIDALQAAGIDVDGVPFEASFGRTTMEYYDGFVFGFLARGRPDLPPVATGGRYDALTRLLGGGRESPAVGGVIRPGMLHQISMETGR